MDNPLKWPHLIRRWSEKTRFRGGLIYHSKKKTKKSLHSERRPSDCETERHAVGQLRDMITVPSVPSEALVTATGRNIVHLQLVVS